MIRSFRHKGLEQFFLTGSRAGIKPDHEKRLRLILGRLHAAREPRDMNLPGLRLHKLHGNLEGMYAVDVSGNFRVTFRCQAGEVHQVDYGDYH